MSQREIQRAEPADIPRRDPRAPALLRALNGRPIVLVGMMGVGKTSVGRRLAARLGLEFIDADVEIEQVAGLSITEIFARYGEPFFRDREHRVVTRLVMGGQRVIATGGGAFVHAATRRCIARHAVSVWLNADFDVLMRRVRKRANRPLLANADPEGVLRRLIAARNPLYATADCAVMSREGPHEACVDAVIETLLQRGPPRAEAAVRVALGARAYDIRIGPGLIAQAGGAIAALGPGAACAIVTDENVARHHLPALEASLTAAGVRHASVITPPGEGAKCYAQFERVCDAIIAARLERNDIVIALGGGVVGDLAGFAAASVRRGMRLVQMPTSLLAQVDSSVGGKTGINSRFGKNLVGAFHQPVLVLADTDALGTLPVREFKAGYAEVVKYGLIDDRPFFEWLEANHRAVFDGGAPRVEAIRASCAAKAAMVARDEHETGDRALLNLGHTFGHAFEALTGYDGARLVHGEGVAIGLACAFRFSQKLGLCAGQDAGRVAAHLTQVGLPTRIRDIPGWDADPEAVLDAMFQDKKVERGALTFILARGIGESFIAKGVAPADVRAFLADELTGS